MDVLARARWRTAPALTRRRPGKWDPKITTFPGLYLLSLPPLHALHAVSPDHSFPGGCTAARVRAVNAALCSLLAPLAWLIVRRANPAARPRSCLAHAAAAALLPIHYFYTALYYTDGVSAVAVLATIAAAQGDPSAQRRLPLARAVLSALVRVAPRVACASARSRGWAQFGAVSVLCRQSNVVWVAFVAGTVALRDARALAPRQTSEK